MKKAILVVSFGTTYLDTRKLTIDIIEERIREKFKDYEIRRAFTSNTIIKVLKNRDNILVDTPSLALQKLKDDGYEDVIVQPLHLIAGDEYKYVMQAIKAYEKYFKKIVAGRPIMFYKPFDQDLPDDYEILVDAVKDIIPNGERVIFMGHGSNSVANACYSCLQLLLWDKGYSNTYIANVEGYPSIENVIKRIKNQDKNLIKESPEVILIPLMIVAGDHAKNDMAGKSDLSWKNILEREGFKVNIYLHGLGELKKFQNIYIKHIEDAIENRYSSYDNKKKEMLTCPK